MKGGGGWTLRNTLSTSFEVIVHYDIKKVLFGFCLLTNTEGFIKKYPNDNQKFGYKKSLRFLFREILRRIYKLQQEGYVYNKTDDEGRDLSKAFLVKLSQEEPLNFKKNYVSNAFSTFRNENKEEVKRGYLRLCQIDDIYNIVFNKIKKDSALTKNNVKKLVYKVCKEETKVELKEENLKKHFLSFKKKYSDKFCFKFPIKIQTKKKVKDAWGDYLKYHEKITKAIVYLVKSGIDDWKHFFFNMDEASCGSWQKPSTKYLSYKRTRPIITSPGKVESITLTPLISCDKTLKKYWTINRKTLEPETLISLGEHEIYQSGKAFNTKKIFECILFDAIEQMEKDVEKKVEFIHHERVSVKKGKIGEVNLKIKPILLLDQASCHTAIISMDKDGNEVYNKELRDRVKIILIPAGLTGCLQPLDLNPFSIFKAKIPKDIEEKKIESRLIIYNRIWNENIFSKHFKAGFERGGVLDGHKLNKIWEKDESYTNEEIKKAEKEMKKKHKFKRFKRIKSFETTNEAKGNSQKRRRKQSVSGKKLKKFRKISGKENIEKILLKKNMKKKKKLKKNEEKKKKENPGIFLRIKKKKS